MPPHSTCSVDDCARPSLTRGWCKMHYLRWWRNGDPLVATTRTDAARFWAKVDRSGGPDACWLWTGNITPDGYATFTVDDRLVRAHRFAYELQVGPIPDRLVIDHLCRNRACQNARHMEPVTNAENIRRGHSGRHNAIKTHCPQGHPYSGDNLYVGRTGKRGCRACFTLRRRQGGVWETTTGADVTAARVPNRRCNDA